MMQQREIMTRLQEIVGELSEQDRQALLAFAEFLSARTARPTARNPSAPEHRPGPPGESVVAAMKRLSTQYPMLDKAKLLGVATGLMGEHVMRGRPADEVIVELEALFDKQYQNLCQEESRES